MSEHSVVITRDTFLLIAANFLVSFQISPWENSVMLKGSVSVWGAYCGDWHLEMEGEESGGFLEHNLRWWKLTYVSQARASCCRRPGTFLKSILNHLRMVNRVRILTRPWWRVWAGACLGLHESHDGRPQFPGNDCAFSSLLESYLLLPSTWDGHVKHGLRPLRFRSAACAARQLTHITANKYEAWGSWLRLERQGWRYLLNWQPGVKDHISCKLALLLWTVMST